LTKVVFFTDLHAHIFEDFAKPDPEFVNDRFRAQMDTLHKVFHIAIENNATVVFGGDLFHKRGKIDDIVFNSVYDVFAEYSNVKTHMVRGNHDSRTNQTVTEHWLKPFRHLPHVEVHDVPQIAFESNDGSELFIYAIPYSDDTVLLKQAIEQYADHAKERPETHSLLVGHIGVDGSEVGRYSHRLEGAFKIGDLFPDVFDYVALGHYHKRQFLGGLDNVFYGGNTIQTSFSDEGQDKGVFLIDFEKGGKPEFIPIPNKKFITLTSVPDDAQEIIDNNYVRFVIPQNLATEIEVFKEESDNIRIEVQREYKTETRIEIGMESTEEQIVEAYTKEFYPEVTSLALDVLKEAMSR
jgi:DNA repair exonuclease SbcCD nuclease subunit